MERNEKEILQDLVCMAKEGGAILKGNYGNEQSIHFKGEIDLVTDVDRQSEERIMEMIVKRFPGHSILTEESPPVEGDSPFRWIIDPLDGTTNYAHGYPFFAVSIALERDGEVIAGVVFDPIREECFEGILGGGAYLNGVRIKVSKVEILRRSLIATGFPYDINVTKQNNIDYFEAYAKAAQALRRDGSAALDLCYLACGRFDGFWELKLKPWDTAAGSLIAIEAGGRITGLAGEAYSIYDGDVLASNGNIHGEMMEVVQRVKRM